MNNADKQYVDLLKDILANGTVKEDRTGTGTIAVFGRQLRFDLLEGFPLLTCKKTHFASIVHELIWFISGDTNIKYLKDNKVSIWDEWARPDGSLGPIYGHQWRNFNSQGIDQLQEIINTLRTNPDSRRIIVCAWNPAQLPEMALPPCHAFFQFFSEVIPEGGKFPGYRKLSLQLYQRSADVGLGVPFNIASYALLLKMVAHVTGHVAGDFVHTFGDTHIYSNHITQVNEVISRPLCYDLPSVGFRRDVREITDFKFEDIILHGYQHHQFIKMDVAI